MVLKLLLEIKSRANDWIIVSKNVVPNIKDFNFIDNLSKVSDHIPIMAKVYMDVSATIEQLEESISEIISIPNNHSKFKKFKMKNINSNAFRNTLETYITEIETKQYTDSDAFAKDIDSALRKSATISSQKERVTNTQNGIRVINVDDDIDIMEKINEDNQNEYATWNELLKEKDLTKIWKQIDFNGKYTPNKIKPENTCNEFADYLEKRCTLPYEHSNFEGIESKIFDPNLDSRITSDEIIEGVKKMNRQSSSRCGIPLSLLMLVINSMLGILVHFFNMVFTSKYPMSWFPFISCLPKKGKLNIPFVRGISLKVILAKIYDTILKNRLERWLKIPIEQTAYQKGKFAGLHVFFVRCLISICKKLRIPLFIGVTDFEAAFDYISRRHLFQKLANLGIGMFMLRALMEMYKMTNAYIFLNGEYSHKLHISSGVLQGAASSTILFIAYTCDIINLFQQTFPAEELLHCYHILLHADDSLILSTSKNSLVEKFATMSKYCKENNIKLQLKKCSFLVINSKKECEDIEMEGNIIENKKEFVYLGSIITNSGDVTCDIKAEINQKEKRLNQFFAFLSQYRNAPLMVKEKVLESCIVSAVLYNCETWGNANLDGLEKKYRKALKHLLALRKSACNEFPYIELGKPTLKSLVYKRQLRFYRDCMINKDYPMQRFIIRKALDADSSFIKHYVNLSEKYADPDQIPMQSLTDLREEITSKAAENRSKYKSFIEMNPLLKRPDLYDSYIQTYKLNYVTRLRSISHNLSIETGRHCLQKTPREERLCKCGLVEDETHFVLICHQYSHIRRKYFNGDMISLEEALDKPWTGDFIYELFECRKLFM